MNHKLHKLFCLLLALLLALPVPAAQAAAQMDA